MKLFVKSLVACSLLIGFVITLPLPEGEEDSSSTTEEVAADATTEGPGDETSEAADEGDGDKKAEEGGEPSAPESAPGDDHKEDGGGDKEEGAPQGSGKDDRLNTYNKVNELLEKGTDVGSVDNEFLRVNLINNLHGRLKMPVIEAIGLIGDFSKIAGCFTSMGGDVKKIIDEKLKSFTTCKAGKDSTDSKCSEDSSTGSQIDQITSKITGCVSSKGN